MLEKIFACIDAQGFTVDGQFLVRELSIVNNVLNQCHEIDTEIKYDNISHQDKKTCEWLRYNLLGLTKRPVRSKIGLPCYRHSDVITVIQQYHNKFSTKEQYAFGVKNDSLIRLLIDANIPYVDLETLNCPATDSLDNIWGAGWYCSYHTVKPIHSSQKYRCALRKATYMWKWVKEEKCVKELIESISDITF